MTIATFLDVEATWATFASGEYETQVRGLRTWKLDDDLRRLKILIESTGPEVIIETGTKFGGSAVWFAQFGVDVISVDIDGTYSEEARHAHPGIHWLIGDSRDPAILDCVRDLVDGRRAMVVLDSEHAAPHVADEILLYSQFVSPGCYLVVEDGIFDMVDPSLAHLGGARIPAEGGPLRAIEGLLPGWRGWERDTEIEQLTSRTYHVAGFWIRTAPHPSRQEGLAALDARDTCTCDHGPEGAILHYLIDCPDHASLVIEGAAAHAAANADNIIVGAPGETHDCGPATIEGGETLIPLAEFGTLTIPGEEPITETPKPKAARKPRKAAAAPVEEPQE